MYRFRITNKSMQAFIDLIRGCLVVQSFDSVHFVRGSTCMYFHKDECVMFKTIEEETGPYGISAADTAILSDLCSARKLHYTLFVDVNLPKKTISVTYAEDDVVGSKDVAFQISNVNYSHTPTDYTLSFMNYMMTSKYEDTFDVFFLDKVKKNDQNLLSRSVPAITVDTTTKISFMMGEKEYDISAYSLDLSTITNNEKYRMKFSIEDLREAMGLCERTLRIFIPKTNSAISTQNLEFYLVVKTGEYSMIRACKATITYFRTTAS